MFLFNFVYLIQQFDDIALQGFGKTQGLSH